MSTTWYTWIEQGRDVSPSPDALAQLAVALRLKRPERAYLFELAGRRDPRPAAEGTEVIPPALVRCVESIAAPAYVLDRLWTARTWNTAAERLFAGWLDGPGGANLLRFIFLEPVARSLICDWERRARRVAAEFRAACSAYLDDPNLVEFVAELRNESPEFARYWDQHGVLDREGGARAFAHPEDGMLQFEQVTFDLASQPSLKLTVLLLAAPDATSTGK